MGIIKPTGERNPGTGRKKRYSDKALVRAVFLQTLIDASGSPAIAFADDIDEVVEAVYWLAGKRWYDKFLVISRPPKMGELRFGTSDHNDLGDYIYKSKFDVHTVVNLRRIYDVLVPLVHDKATRQKKLKA
jgi:hypothetical protein